MFPTFESLVCGAWCGRRRATRSGVTPVVMNALADSGGVGDGMQRFGASHRQSRSMSVSLEAVARAVQFSGVGKEVRRRRDAPSCVVLRV